MSQDAQAMQAHERHPKKRLMRPTPNASHPSASDQGKEAEPRRFSDLGNPEMASHQRKPNVREARMREEAPIRQRSIQHDREEEESPGEEDDAPENMMKGPIKAVKKGGKPGNGPRRTSRREHVRRSGRTRSQPKWYGDETKDKPDDEEDEESGMSVPPSQMEMDVNDKAGRKARHPNDKKSASQRRSERLMRTDSGGGKGGWGDFAVEDILNLKSFGARNTRQQQQIDTTRARKAGLNTRPTSRKEWWEDDDDDEDGGSGWQIVDDEPLIDDDDDDDDEEESEEEGMGRPKNGLRIDDQSANSADMDHGNATGKGSKSKSDNDDSETGEEAVFCLCRSPADNEFMICCDSCSEWFHGRCVKITEDDAKHIDLYTCPLCVQQQAATRASKADASGAKGNQQTNRRKQKQQPKQANPPDEPKNLVTKSTPLKQEQATVAAAQPVITKRPGKVPRKPQRGGQDQLLRRRLEEKEAEERDLVRKKRKLKDEGAKDKKRQKRDGDNNPLGEDDKSKKRKKNSKRGDEHDNERAQQQRREDEEQSIAALTQLREALFFGSGNSKEPSGATGRSNQNSDNYPPAVPTPKGKRGESGNKEGATPTRGRRPKPRSPESDKQHAAQSRNNQQSQTPAPPLPQTQGSLIPHILRLRDDAGINLWDLFFDKDQSDFVFSYLYKEISWKQSKPDFFGYPEPKTTACHGEAGFEYRNNGATYPHSRWTDVLLEIKRRVEGALRCNFNSVQLTKYQSGTDCSSWEGEDDGSLLSLSHPNVAVLFFGEERQYLVRHKATEKLTDQEWYELRPQHGSMMLLWGTTMLHYQQMIPKQPAVTGVSITMAFRNVTSRASPETPTPTPAPLSSSTPARDSSPLSLSGPSATAASAPASLSNSSQGVHPGHSLAEKKPPSWMADYEGRENPTPEPYGIGVGKVFASRAEVVASSLHAQAISDIAGSVNRGVESLILSNDGCVREDNGESIVYCIPTALSHVDRSLTSMMFAAHRRQNSHSLRVIRSWKTPGIYAPKEDGSYRYDGWYKVVNSWVEKGSDDGADICYFRLVRQPNQVPIPVPPTLASKESKEDLDAWRWAKMRELEEEMMRKGLLGHIGMRRSSFTAETPPTLPFISTAASMSLHSLPSSSPAMLSIPFASSPAAASYMPPTQAPPSPPQSAPTSTSGVPSQTQAPVQGQLNLPLSLPLPGPLIGQRLATPAFPQIATPVSPTRGPPQGLYAFKPQNGSPPGAAPQTTTTNIINNISNTINVINNISPSPPATATSSNPTKYVSPPGSLTSSANSLPTSSTSTTTTLTTTTSTSTNKAQQQTTANYSISQQQQQHTYQPAYPYPHLPAQLPGTPSKQQLPVNSTTSRNSKGDNVVVDLTDAVASPTRAIKQPSPPRGLATTGSAGWSDAASS